MNNILLWMEQEKIPLTEEQKAVVTQFEQELDKVKAQVQELQKDVEERQLAQLVEEALARAGVKNIRVLWALLDKERISMEEGQLIGLDEQLKALKEDKETAFLFASSHPQPRFVALGRNGRHREDGARAVMGLTK